MKTATPLLVQAIRLCTHALIGVLLAASPLTARQYWLPETLHYAPLARTSRPDAGTIQLDFSANSYTKSAQKAFLELGKPTDELSTLVFGASDFRLSHAFENCFIPLNTQYYSPYVRILSINPRISYEESGTHFSCTLTSAPFASHTRAGIRLAIPLKKRSVQRHDAGWKDTEQVQDLVAYRPGYVGPTNTSTPDDGYAYRLDLIEALPQNPNGISALTCSSTDTKAFDQPISLPSSGNKVGVALVCSPEGHVPSEKKLSVLSRVQASTDAQNDIPFANTAHSTLSNVTNQEAYYYLGTQSYSGIIDRADKDTASQIADQERKASIWVIPTYDDIGNLNNRLSVNVQTTLQAYRSNIYEWLSDRGYEFASSTATGLGDLHLEAFIEHDLNAFCTLSLMAGVVAPTATGETRATNPYAVHLGNGGHTEVYGGGSITLATMPGSRLENISVSLSGMAAHVIEAPEWRMATPRNALIKNVGPEINSLVRWNYCTASALIACRHPVSPYLSGDCEYRFSYKGTDTITFPQREIPSWLGKSFGTQTYSEPTTTELDPAVAAQRTTVVAHKVSGHLYYQPSDYLLFSCGVGAVLGGKNAPAETEYMLGITISA